MSRRTPAGPIARVWPADLENRKDDLLVELPKVIEYYERRVRRSQKLQQLKVVGEAETEADLKEFREELTRHGSV